MTQHHPARRRFIHISATFGGALLINALNPLPVRASSSASIHSDQNRHTWTGIALGADASLQINHPDPAAARALIKRCVAEVRRLESLFSLYRDDSALVRLNRYGVLDNPAGDFLALLDRSREFSRLTHGTFDVTIQPLWQAYADYFSSQPASSRPHGDTTARPPALQQAIDDALSRVDWRKLHIDSQQIQLTRPGMAVTLNGIAQGYITDRITQILSAHGVDHALVNMGEIYGMNPEEPSMHPPWQVGLEDARQPGQIAQRVTLHNQAVATSGAYGTPFTHDLRHNHLLDPRRGESSHRYRSVSVVAHDATTADALSTAFSLMPEPAILALSRKLNVTSYLQPIDGGPVIRLS